MSKYAYFDHTLPSPQRIIGWFDADLIDYGAALPDPADRLNLTDEQWTDTRLGEWANDNGSLIAYVPPEPPPPTLQQQAMMRLAQPLNIECTSLPELNGPYAIDPTSRSNITGVAVAINAGLGLPSDSGTFQFADATGAPHAWPAEQFISFAKAVMTYVYNLGLVAGGARLVRYRLTR